MYWKPSFKSGDLYLRISAPSLHGLSQRIPAYSPVLDSFGSTFLIPRDFMKKSDMHMRLGEQTRRSLPFPSLL